MKDKAGFEFGEPQWLQKSKLLSVALTIQQTELYFTDPGMKDKAGFELYFPTI